MTWVRLNDQMPDHPKVLAAGAEPMWLYTAALCWCARHLTDGRIPKPAVPRLAVVKSPDKCAAKLVEVGLWDEDGDDFVVHDYLKFQPSREQVESQRESARNRQRKSRSRHAVTDAVSAPTPTHPTPSHVADSSTDDDKPSTRNGSSSSDDPHHTVWVTYANLVADDQPELGNRKAFIARVIRNAKAEKRADLEDLLQQCPEASAETLGQWLYSGLDPSLLASFEAAS